MRPVNYNKAYIFKQCNRPICAFCVENFDRQQSHCAWMSMSAWKQIEFSTNSDTIRKMVVLSTSGDPFALWHILPKHYSNLSKHPAILTLLNRNLRQTHWRNRGQKTFNMKLKSHLKWSLRIVDFKDELVNNAENLVSDWLKQYG